MAFTVLAPMQQMSNGFGQGLFGSFFHTLDKCIDFVHIHLSFKCKFDIDSIRLSENLKIFRKYLHKMIWAIGDEK